MFRPHPLHPHLRPPSLPPAAKSDALAQYKEGDRVSHRTFGNGTVIRAYTDLDSGNDTIEICFDQYGTKTLLLTYAKLVKMA